MAAAPTWISSSYRRLACLILAEGALGGDQAGQFARVTSASRTVSGGYGLPAVEVWSVTRRGRDRHHQAAVAWDAQVPVRLDAEPHGPLPDGVLEAIAPRRRTSAWDRLLFCAKECVYKAWFPLARRWLDFMEADIELRPDGTFAVWPLVPGPTTPGGAALTGFAGRRLVEDGPAVTAIT